MDLTIYKDPNHHLPQEDIVKNVEEGTMLDKDKKKKKKKQNKNKETNKNKDIDEDKIKEEAK